MSKRNVINAPRAVCRLASGNLYSPLTGIPKLGLLPCYMIIGNFDCTIFRSPKIVKNGRDTINDALPRFTFYNLQ